MGFLQLTKVCKFIVQLQIYTFFELPPVNKYHHSVITKTYSQISKTSPTFPVLETEARKLTLEPEEFKYLCDIIIIPANDPIYSC